jgi:hypothetical protein
MQCHLDSQLTALCLTLAAVLSAGCASTTGPTAYPANWPPLDSTTTADGCPRISGTYSNSADATFPPELVKAPGLNEVFARMGRGTGMASPKANNRSWPEAATAKAVSFTLTSESLQLAFDPKSESTVRLDFRRYHASLSETRFDDLFTCYAVANGARLRFMAEPESHSGVFANLYMEAGGTLVHLLRASDGSLIVQWRSESVAISSVLLGSHVRFNSVWWKYPLLSTGP